MTTYDDRYREQNSVPEPDFQRVEGDLPIAQPLRLWWDDPELEPKQQHRFLAQFPVYMPAQNASVDSRRIFSQLYAQNSEATAQAAAANREFMAQLFAGQPVEFDNAGNYHSGNLNGEQYSLSRDTAGNRRAIITFALGLPPEPELIRIAKIFDARNAMAEFVAACIVYDVKGGTANDITFTSKMIALFGITKKNPSSAMSELWDLVWTNPALLRTGTTGTPALSMRISTYVVSGFTPPVYGQELPQKQMPGQSTTYSLDAAAKATSGTATLVLVSTLQDDLQFSMNLLFQYAAFVADTQDGVFKMPLFPRDFKPPEKKYAPVLVIAEMSAGYKTAFPAGFGKAAGPLGAQGKGPERVSKYGGTLPAGPGSALYPLSPDGNTHPGTAVGFHKFYNPYITNVQTSNFSYEGAELVKTTITLQSSADAASWYSYEIAADEVGSTRVPNQNFIAYSNEPGIKNGLLRQLNQGIYQYPNALVRREVQEAMAAAREAARGRRRERLQQRYLASKASAQELRFLQENLGSLDLELAQRNQQFLQYQHQIDAQDQTQARLEQRLQNQFGVPGDWFDSASSQLHRDRMSEQWARALRIEDCAKRAAAGGPTCDRDGFPEPAAPDESIDW